MSINEKLGLPKEHYIDAVAICLEDNVSIKLSDTVLIRRCVSEGDYQQTKGPRSNIRIPTGKLVGLRKFDLVKTIKGVGFVKGKRSSGYFSIDGISNSVNVKKSCTRLSARKTVIMQYRHDLHSSPRLKTKGFPGEVL